MKLYQYKITFLDLERRELFISDVCKTREEASEAIAHHEKNLNEKGYQILITQIREHENP